MKIFVELGLKNRIFWHMCVFLLIGGVDTKKEDSKFFESSNNHLGGGVGFEPTTFGTTIRRSNQLS